MQFTIRQKLVSLTLGLVILVIGLSVFFLFRFSAMGSVYRLIPDERVPQQIVAQSMSEALIRARVGLNEMVGVERNQANFETFKQEVQHQFEIYEWLSQVLLQGTGDLGQKVEGSEGLSVRPCRKGGQIEALNQQALAGFQEYQKTCQAIMEKKKQQLAFVHQIGWYVTETDSQGAVKALVDIGRTMERLAVDPESRFLVSDLRRQEKNLLMRATKEAVEQLKSAGRKLVDASQGDLRASAQSYLDEFDGIFTVLLDKERIGEELKSLVRVDLGKRSAPGGPRHQQP